jgi:hypothetical protein
MQAVISYFGAILPNLRRTVRVRKAGGNGRNALTALFHKTYQKLGTFRTLESPARRQRRIIRADVAFLGFFIMGLPRTLGGCVKVLYRTTAEYPACEGRNARQPSRETPQGGTIFPGMSDMTTQWCL